jgi:cytochrome c peroxidase
MKKHSLLLFLCLWTLGLAGCLVDKAEEPERDPGYTDGNWTPERPVLPNGWPALEWPRDNPYSSAKAVLGRRLFFETTLSRDHTLSCASCHQPGSAFTAAGRTFSFGVSGIPMHRNTPSLANIGFGKSFMFDGEVPSLELQALKPLLAEDEMGMTAGEVESRLGADTLYVRLFRQAYGKGEITLAGVTKALATYQRLLVSYRSPYDGWKAGDEGALSAAAKRGEALFMGKGDCWRCHAPPLFTNGAFHNTGLDSVITDVGRKLITGLAADEGRFKTPSLRNVGMTGPYMHDGSLLTLADVVEHYNAGRVPHPNTDTLMRPLGLAPGEVSDLLAFLESLTDSSALMADQGP